MVCVEKEDHGKWCRNGIIDKKFLERISFFGAGKIV